MGSGAQTPSLRFPAAFSLSALFLFAHWLHFLQARFSLGPCTLEKRLQRLQNSPEGLLANRRAELLCSGPQRCLRQVLTGWLESGAQLCASHYSKGKRATLVGQTENRYPPHVGEVRSAPPEPYGMGSPRKAWFYFQEKQEVSRSGKDKKSPLLLSIGELHAGGGQANTRDPLSARINWRYSERGPVCWP